MNRTKKARLIAEVEANGIDMDYVAFLAEQDGKTVKEFLVEHFVRNYPYTKYVAEGAAEFFVQKGELV